MFPAGYIDTVREHMDRHVVPEVGRVINLPHQKRVMLGYWKDEVAVGDASDIAAYAKAVRLARDRKTRSGRIAACADRYASHGAEPVQMDEARAACLLAMRAAMDEWAGGEFSPEALASMPESTTEQLRVVANMHEQASLDLKSALRKRKANKKLQQRDPA